MRIGWSMWSTPLRELAALSPNRFPVPVTRVVKPANRKYSAYLVGVLLAIASIYAVPQAIDPTLVKYSLATCEILTILLLARLARFGGPRDVTLLAAAVAVVLAKTMYGVIVAYSLWHVPIVDALLEARFGFAICSLPLTIFLYARSTRVEMQQLLIAFTATVVILDLIVVSIFPDMISFGQRGANRFVISMMGAAGIAYFYLLKAMHSGFRPHMFLLTLVLIWLLHVFAVTTSRADAAVLAGLSLTLLLSFARVRQALIITILGILAPVILAIVVIVVTTSETLAGRDVAYFVDQLTNTFPLGVGFLPDSTRNSSVVHFTPIFASDYGVGLYVYRYGLLSVGMLAALIYVLTQGIRTALRLSGAPVFILAVFAYILIVPFWEYGALNGAFLTAALLYVPPPHPPLSRSPLGLPA